MNNYSKIFDPKTGKAVNTRSKLGKTIIKKYLKILCGGESQVNVSTDLDNSINYFIYIFNSFDTSCLSNIVSKNISEIKKSNINNLYLSFSKTTLPIGHYDNLISTINTQIILDTMNKYQLLDIIYTLPTMKLFLIFYLFFYTKINLSTYNHIILSLSMLECLSIDIIEALFSQFDEIDFNYAVNLMLSKITKTELESIQNLVENVIISEPNSLRGGAGKKDQPDPKGLIVYADTWNRDIITVLSGLVFLILPNIPICSSKIIAAGIAGWCIGKANKIGHELHAERIGRKLGVIFDDDCEPIEVNNRILKNWKDRKLSPWTDLYKNKPIFIICAHGLIDFNYIENIQKIRTKEIPKKLPKNVQVISMTRSGHPVLNYPNLNKMGTNIDVEGGILDACISAGNPNNIKYHYFKDNGIIRNRIFKPTMINEYEDARNNLNPSCQKLYREGDNINDISLSFDDPNDSFKNIGGTGIYIFSDVTEGRGNIIDKLENRIDEYNEKVESSEYQYWDKFPWFRIENEYLETFTKDFENPLALSYRYAGEDYKDASQGDVYLSEIIKTFGEGTYFVMSCKNLPKKTKANRDELEKYYDLVRAVSQQEVDLTEKKEIEDNIFFGL